MRPQKPTAKRTRSTPAGRSRWSLFAMGSLSVFLFGAFALGNLATSPQATVELRLNSSLAGSGLGAYDPSVIAGEIASQMRPDPTASVNEVMIGGADNRLSLLNHAQITFDHSESDGAIVRIHWTAEKISELRLTESGQDPATAFANTGHAFAKEISDRARRQASANHLASGQLLDKTTSQIDQLERNLQELLENKLNAEDVVSPISYQSPGSGNQGDSRPTIRRTAMNQQPPGLLINDFARELESIQDAERLREMKMRLMNERSQLLQNLTEKHPDVLRKDMQIDYVQTKIDALPVTPLPGTGGARMHDVAAEIGGSTGESSERVDELMAKLQSLQNGQQSLFAEWHKRMLTLNQLKQDRNAQLKAERIALAACVNLAEMEIANVEHVELKREIVPARWGMMAGVLVFGAVVAGGSLSGWGKRCAATFGSLDDVRKTAGIPIVGTISSAEPDTVSRAARSRSLFRMASFACEMFLLVTILWIVVLAIADLEYRALLLDNPLAAMLETCSRSWHLLLG